MGDADLISVLLGHGTKQHPVRQVAIDVLTAMGGLGSLARASPDDLINVSGVGTAQAARLVAAFTLGRRALEQSPGRVAKLAGPDAVWHRLLPRMKGLMQEVFMVVGINTRGVVIGEHEVARGTLSRVDVHPRDVFRPLVEMSAAAGVVAHNHPSGDLEPSEQDITLTIRLRAAGAVMGIPIVDHVVITDHGFRSINDVLGTDLEAWLPE